MTADTVVATSQPGQAFANPVLFQPSGDFIEGRLIGAGGENTDDQIFRFSETGVIDHSFSSTVFGFPGVNMNSPLTLGLQSNGKILVGGVPFGLARLNTDGELDTTFGSGGMVETPAGESLDSLLIQTDGKIVAIGGGRGPNSTFQLILARYLAN